jgi:hypothetical protein
MPVNTTSSGTYTSGGTTARVYEIRTPYREADIAEVQYTQNADTMYLSHNQYEPRKLTRAGHASWTLATYTRTADPWTPTQTKTINAFTAASPGVGTTSAAHGLAVGDEIEITGTANGSLWDDLHTVWTVNTVPTGSTFTLKDPDTGVVLDTTGYGALPASKTLKTTNAWPAAVSFVDAARLMFGGTRTNPETLWTSRSPTAAGATLYDDFTTGTLDTDAVIFTLAPVHGKVDSIQWITSTNKFIAVGTFAAIRRIYGATETEPISATSLTAKAINSYGCAKTLPVSTGLSLYYIQRGGKQVRSVEYDLSSDGYITSDRNLVSEHLTSPGINRIVEQQGAPDILWVVRDDGKLLGLTYKESEAISSWHRHYIGGQHVDINGILQDFAKVLAIGRMPRPVGGDQLWLVVERKIGLNTIRSVEYVADVPPYVLRSDFYGGGNDLSSRETDDIKYRDAQYEIQKDAVHLDMSIQSDGSGTGVSLGTTVTPSATSGVGITLVASAATFTASMVGAQIWKKYDVNGNGGGRALITAYADSTHITATVLSSFNNTEVIPAGSWFITSSTASGLEYLEGQNVNVTVDGGPIADAVVTAGAIAFANSVQASKANVGFKYKGRIETLNIDTGGVTGSAEVKPRNLIKAAIRFFNAVGCSFGTNLYRLERLVFRSTADPLDRAVPLFTGVKEQVYLDQWESDNKQVVIVQDVPSPCTVLSMDMFMDTSDE